ncbi:MAG: MATE family efflux transporter [Salinigranum sp.]
MLSDSDRLLSVWRRSFSIGWPVSVQASFQTLMRTTDIIVTGLFSPAAVAALGLADVYAELVMRLGNGLGAGAIALSSQDTGSGATANRDEAITQALLLGFLAGVPFVVFGLLFGRQAIAFLGASPKVSRLGGDYLAVIFLAAPARHMALIGVKALQGTGDTRTPMRITIAANVINITASVVLGLGLGPAPQLSIFGVGLGTAVANTFTAGAIVVAIWIDRTPLSLTRPADLTITRQLVTVSTPMFAEGLSQTLIYFPFNALLLLFGTNVNAAYQIGRRLRQQFTAPIYRAYATGGSIMVGQQLGAEDPDSARFNGWAVIALSALTLGLIGTVVFVGAKWIVLIFTRDPATLQYAIGFTRAFAVASVFLGLYFTVRGALQGAGETRVPFAARLTGSVFLLLGFSYVTSVTLGYGVLGIYAGVVLSSVWMMAVVLYGFSRGSWDAHAAAMIEERASHS